MGQGWSDLWLITQEIPKQPISIGDFYDHDFTSPGNLLTSNGTNTGYQNLCWHGAGYQKNMRCHKVGTTVVAGMKKTKTKAEVRRSRRRHHQKQA